MRGGGGGKEDCGSGSAWIPIILGSRIRIRIRVKTGSEPDLHPSQTSGAAEAKMEPKRTVIWPVRAVAAAAVAGAEPSTQHRSGTQRPSHSAAHNKTGLVSNKEPGMPSKSRHPGFLSIPSRIRGSKHRIRIRNHCCGTVNIFYGSGSTIDKLRFRLLTIYSYGSGSGSVSDNKKHFSKKWWEKSCLFTWYP